MKPEGLRYFPTCHFDIERSLKTSASNTPVNGIVFRIHREMRAAFSSGNWADRTEASTNSYFYSGKQHSCSNEARHRCSKCRLILPAFSRGIQIWRLAICWLSRIRTISGRSWARCFYEPPQYLRHRGTADAQLLATSVIIKSSGSAEYSDHTRLNSDMGEFS